MANPKPPIVCSLCGLLVYHYGKAGICPDCYNREYRRTHKAEHAAHERERRKNKPDSYVSCERKRRQNPERQEWKHAYYLSHKDYFAMKQREYRLRHRDKANARWERWYANNPDKVKAKRMRSDQVRRHRKLTTPCILTREQWLAIQVAYGHRCAYCGEKRRKLTQDHVIPLSKGGGYTPDNIVPSCRHCNSQKCNRPPLREPPIRLML